MKEDKNNQQPQSKPCPKDCRLCDFRQHAFCAAQISYYIIEKLNEIDSRLAELESGLKDSVSTKELKNPIQNIAQ